MKPTSYLPLLAFFIFAIQSPLHADWTQTSVMPNGMVKCIVPASGADVYLGETGGVLRSTDNGATWNPAMTGIAANNVYALVKSGTYIFAGTDVDGLYYSTDNGGHWKAADSGYSYAKVNALAVSGGNVFAGSTSISPLSPCGVFLTTDNGNSWNAENTGLTNKYVISLAVSGSTLFAGTFGGGIFLSTDNGAHWNAVNSNLTMEYASFDALAVSGASIFGGTESGNGIFRTTDYGVHWDTVNTGLTNNYYNTVYSFAVSGANIFAGTTFGVFVTSDNGAHWNSVNAGLSADTAFSLAISGGYLVAGTSTGVWRRPLSEMVSAVNEHSTGTLSSVLQLIQNYPNPFSGVTNIEFRMTNDEPVTLKVYDALGREVADLTNQIGYSSTANRRVAFDASGLPAGVYISRAQSATAMQQQLLLLVK